MTTTLKKSSNNGVHWREDGVLVRTPQRLVVIPKAAYLSGIAIEEDRLVYQLPGQTELAQLQFENAEAAQQAFDAIERCLGESGSPAEPARDAFRDSPALPESANAKPLRKRRWRRAAAVVALGAVSFWFFQGPPPVASNTPPMALNSPAQAKEQHAMAADPLAQGLLASAADAEGVSGAPAQSQAAQPYQFKPRLVMPDVKAPALNCD